ncbi:MAG: HDOD domain-containing protein [Planctomycetota bacterium]
MATALDTLRSELEKRLNQRDIELPLIPETAAAVMKMSADPNCVASELADLIRHDQSLAAQVMRRVNSALDAPMVPIASLQMAVSRLGMAKVRRLAITVACKSRVFDAVGFEDRLSALFRHCLATAGFAQEIARVRRENVEEAFFAGLLHDVGTAVICQTLSDLYGSNFLRVDEAEVDGIIDDLHCDFGEVLLREWNMAEDLGLVARFHHQPELACSAENLARTVHFAQDLADVVSCEETLREVAFEHDELAALLLYETDVEQIIGARDSVLNLLETM